MAKIKIIKDGAGEQIFPVTIQEAIINKDTKKNLVHDLSLKADITYVDDKVKSEIPLVIGTQTATTASWTGVAPFSTLTSGTTIRYWLPRTSATNVTLNLTLKGGGTTGAIACYYGGTSRLTTHYPAGSYINLTYLEGALINGTSYTGWWAQSNYADGTESYTVRWNTPVKAGSEITRYKIVMQGSDGGYHPITIGNTTAATKTVSTVPFLIGSPILWYFTTATVASGALTSTSYNYTAYTTSTTTYTFNQSSGFRAGEDVYLKGTVNGAFFTLDNTTLTSHLTQDLPTVDDGFYYMRLGVSTNTTTGFRLTNQHPIYYFQGGELQSLNTSHGADWDAIIGKPDTFPATAHSHTLTSLSEKNYSSLDGKPALGTASSKNVGTASGNIPILGSDGKLNDIVIPKIAISETSVVATQALMLALTAETGDIAIRTDLNKAFILTKAPASTLANWQELLTPTSPVQSVAGKTGVVTLVSGDVGLGNVNNTSDANKPVSTAQASALELKVDKITGKGLSTNDYTTAEKNKLGGIATGANNYTHPATHPASIIAQTASARFVTDVEKADWNTKETTEGAQAKADGALSSAKDYTDGKVLTNVPLNAKFTDTVYTHPTYTARASGLYKITVDTLGHISGVTAVVKSDITGLGIPAQDTTYGIATTSANGLMSSTDKSKLNGIAQNANNYSLPTASGTVLGGIKVGSRLTIASGTLSADSQTENNFTTVLKTKLDGIESGANKYTHPTKHPASIITQDASNRFVTDAEKSTWNAKETPSGAQTKATTALNSAKAYTNTAEVNHKKEDAPHQYGSKFEWVYNANTESLDLNYIG